MAVYPIISQYAFSVAEPFGLFRTLGEPVCEKNNYGEPKIYAGGNAAVFKISLDDREYALKCYTKPHKRARSIIEYLSGIEPELIYKTNYLPEEIFIYDRLNAGRYYDVSITEWSNGNTLEYDIRKALHHNNPTRLAELSAAFDRMAAELLSSEWAHGDIKPENIMVEPDAKMRLIDYDALYFSGFEGCAAHEIGTPAYQHPLRGTGFFNPHIDDYPVALISATLHALSEKPELHRMFGNKDRLLFSPDEILNGSSDGHKYVIDMASRSGNKTLLSLLRKLCSPTPRVEGLTEILSAPLPNGRRNLSAFVKNGYWGYEDENGNTVIEPVFNTALEFSEGVAAVNLNGYHHYINSAGEILLNCSGYENIKSFSEGTAAVKRGGLWGYIDKAGEEIVAPQFKKAFSAREGIVRISHGNGIEELSIAQLSKKND